MQLWYLTVEFQIWNVIYVFGNWISRWSLNFVTELCMNYTELQVQKNTTAYPLWNPRFATAGWILTSRLFEANPLNNKNLLTPMSEDTKPWMVPLNSSRMRSTTTSSFATYISFFFFSSSIFMCPSPMGKEGCPLCAHRKEGQLPLLLPLPLDLPLVDLVWVRVCLDGEALPGREA